MRKVSLITFAGMLMLSLCISVRAELLPDDHGNSVATATALSGPSNVVSGIMDYDTDADVFSFSFYPARSYIIQVMTGTVDDVELKITPPNWSDPYFETNTVRESPADFSWTNNGAIANWHLYVASMFAYTTGSYQLAVWESPFDQDLDGDGMTDSWEEEVLGSVTNNPGDDNDHDSQTNFEEFLAQTDGGDADSLVKVDAINKNSDDDIVEWYQAGFTTYEIHTSTNLLGPWFYLNENLAGELSGAVVWTNGPAGDPVRFYRVRFVY